MNFENMYVKKETSTEGQILPVSTPLVISVLLSVFMYLSILGVLFRWSQGISCCLMDKVVTSPDSRNMSEDVSEITLALEIIGLKHIRDFEP